MIHSVYSDRQSFRRVSFVDGFNIVLADRTQSSTKKDSRNSIGKSTLIEIIHFCLGAKFANCRLLRSPDLHDWTFSVVIDIQGQKCIVSRNTADEKKIRIQADTTSWPAQPIKPKDKSLPYYSWSVWNDLLGQIFFGVSTTESQSKYYPAFRSLVSYFVRRDRDGFSSPFKHHDIQQPWDSQICVAFLLGLSWPIYQEFQLTKDKEKVLKSIGDAREHGYFDAMIGSVGKLEADRVRLQQQVDSEAQSLKTYVVVDQYRSIEQAADSMTGRLHELENSILKWQRLLRKYESTLETEVAPPDRDIEDLYREAGIALPGLVVKRFEDANAFHRQVLANRKHFLESEIRRLSASVQETQDQVKKLSDDRAELLRTLESGGALEEYTALQRVHAGTVAKLKEIVLRIDGLKKIEQGKSEIKINFELLQQRARTDLDERAPQRERALGVFSEYSSVLHRTPGRLVLNVGKTGLKFDTDVQGSGGGGVDNTSIFCFDLMLSTLWSDRKPALGFLVHDSILFDGVDERQRALAIELAVKKSRQHGFQYICTLNSDALPTSEFSSGFSVDEFVRLRLTDEKPEGTLTGIRFKAPSQGDEEESRSSGPDKQ